MPFVDFVWSENVQPNYRWRRQWHTAALHFRHRRISSGYADSRVHPVKTLRAE